MNHICSDLAKFFVNNFVALFSSTRTSLFQLRNEAKNVANLAKCTRSSNECVWLVIQTLNSEFLPLSANFNSLSGPHSILRCLVESWREHSTVSAFFKLGKFKVQLILAAVQNLRRSLDVETR